MKAAGIRRRGGRGGGGGGTAVCIINRLAVDAGGDSGDGRDADGDENCAAAQSLFVMVWTLHTRSFSGVSFSIPLVNRSRSQGFGGWPFSSDNILANYI